MDTIPRVSIIILNWNGWRDTIECLESVYGITYPNYDVIVVDNGSKNDSVTKIREYAEGKLGVISSFFRYSGDNKPLHYIEYSREETEGGGMKEAEIADLPPWRRIVLIKNPENSGFAEGNNIGIKYALKVLNPEYVLLLNNDTVVEKNFLNELVGVAESDKGIGFVGPKTYYYDYYGRTDVINFAGGRLVIWKGKSAHIGVNEIDKGQYNTVTDVDYVEGSCLLARRKVLELVGLLDPVYFLYWEEADWCIRVKKAGSRLVYAPKSKIWHKISASSKKASSTTQYYMARNRSWFVMKNGSTLEKVGYLVYFFGYLVFNVAMSILYYRDVEKYKFTVKGLIDGFL